MTSFVSLLLPAFVANRLRRTTTVENAPELFDISPLVNRIGYSTMKVEHAFIRAGVSLPAGSSLLAVATRRV